MDILLANPRSFCAGVDRAIAIVEQLLEEVGAPVYVYHEIVHNNFVLDTLRGKGARFIDDLSEAPDGAVLVFNAHGVSRKLMQAAADRGMQVVDATCPMVSKVHREVVKQRTQGRDVLLVGQPGHAEVIGTTGQVASGVHVVQSQADVARVIVADGSKVAWVTQTTLSVDDAAEIVAAIQRRFPAAVGPKTDDICYASQNRQAAVRSLAAQCDLLIVVGSVQSHNTGRLAAIARTAGIEVRQVDSAGEIDKGWLANASTIGVTAGASAPPQLVDEVIGVLRASGAKLVREVDGPVETVVFPLPRGMRQGPSTFWASGPSRPSRQAQEGESSAPGASSASTSAAS